MTAQPGPAGQPGPAEVETVEEVAPPALDVRGLRVDHHGRPVVGPVDATVAAGDLLVVQGPAGSGRTSLLLALSGRMAATARSAAVCGVDLQRHAGRVRHRVALGELRGVNDLDDALTVEQLVAERLVLHQPWWKPWVSARRVEEVFARVDAALREEISGIGHDALRRRAFVSDLAPLERFVLGVVLALVGGPDVLVVDDVDALRDAGERHRAWEGLLGLTSYPHRAADGSDLRRSLTVVATCQDADAADAVAALAGAGGDGRAVHVLRLPARPPVPPRRGRHLDEHHPDHADHADQDHPGAE